MEAQQSEPKKDVLTWILAILGTALVSFTILAPIVLTVIFAIQERIFLFDYLMPAELFPIVLGGGVLLFLAALRQRSHRKWIGWSLGSGIALLVGVLLIPALTGLANGTAPIDSAWLTIVLIFLAGYILAVICLIIGGVLLLIKIFQPRTKTSKSV